MHCDEFADRLDGYLHETLDGADRDAFRLHLARCDRCREMALRAEPTLLFSISDATEPSPAKVEDLTRAVMGDIRRQRISRTLRRRPSGWLAAAATVVISVAAVVGWRLVGPTTEQPAETVVGAQQADHHNPPPRIEVNMAGEGVRVYQYADEHDADTAVYFIVNPAMEL